MLLSNVQPLNPIALKSSDGRYIGMALLLSLVPFQGTY